MPLGIFRCLRGRRLYVTRIPNLRSTRTDILSDARYRPYGGVTQAVYGDGNVLDITYDASDRATRLTRGQDGAMLMDYGFVHDKSGNILEINDGVRPERSQLFTYDGLSRLTYAEGGYQELEYRYNPRGDRTRLNERNDSGSLISRTNTRFDSETARVSHLEKDGQTFREFTYAPSGQIVSDRRNGVETAMILNARGRMASVTRDGASVADYGYDIHQLRISKTLADGTIIHYHYDDQGRMISETNGGTGEIIREYNWLKTIPNDDDCGCLNGNL